MQPGVLPKQVSSRLTPEMRRKLRYGWEFLNFGVLGLNSFVLLYLHSARRSIQAVICGGMAGYAPWCCFSKSFSAGAAPVPGGWSFSDSPKRCSG